DPAHVRLGIGRERLSGDSGGGEHRAVLARRHDGPPAHRRPAAGGPRGPTPLRRLVGIDRGELLWGAVKRLLWGAIGHGWGAQNRDAWGRIASSRSRESRRP